MKRITAALVATALAGGAALPAAAEDSCKAIPAINTLSDIVLKERSALPRLVARRYGAEAAYLKLKYGTLSARDAEDMLQGLVKANATAADDLSYAWHIQKDGYAKAISELGEQQLSMLVSTTGISTIRALLLQDGGLSVLMRSVAVASPIQIAATGDAVVAAIIDQPDALKEKLVHAAEALGLPIIAAEVSASEIDPGAWKAFLARQAGKQDPADLEAVARAIPAMVDKPMPEGWSYGDHAIPVAMHSILRAQALEPEQDFLLFLLNTFGTTNELAITANLLASKIESGEIPRTGSMDSAWLLAYRNAISWGRADAIAARFAIVPYSGRRYVRSSGPLMLSDVIDRLLLVETLKPYLNDPSAAEPSPPAGLSKPGATAWQNWLTISKSIRSASLAPDAAKDPASFGIAAELLFAKGDLQALQALVSAAPAGEARVTAANDYAIRLDRSCSSYLYRPAEAALLAGQPRFTFDKP